RARFNIDVMSPTSLTTQTDIMAQLAVSPDGGRLAYHDNMGRGLYLRPLDSPQPRLVGGTENGANPFFSPDGEWLGFTAGGKLQKVALARGAPRAPPHAAECRGGN